MAEIAGLIAQALFIMASGAQAKKSFSDGHSEGVSHGLIWMLLVGFLIMIWYVLSFIGGNLVLLSGYVGQLFFCLIIGKFKYFPREAKAVSVLNK